MSGNAASSGGALWKTRRAPTGGGGDEASSAAGCDVLSEALPTVYEGVEEVDGGVVEGEEAFGGLHTWLFPLKATPPHPKKIAAEANSSHPNPSASPPSPSNASPTFATMESATLNSPAATAAEIATTTSLENNNNSGGGGGGEVEEQATGSSSSSSKVKEKREEISERETSGLLPSVSNLRIRLTPFYPSYGDPTPIPTFLFAPSSPPADGHIPLIDPAVAENSAPHGQAMGVEILAAAIEAHNAASNAFGVLSEARRKKSEASTAAAAASTATSALVIAANRSRALLNAETEFEEAAEAAGWVNNAPPPPPRKSFTSAFLWDAFTTGPKGPTRALCLAAARVGLTPKEYQMHVLLSAGGGENGAGGVGKEGVDSEDPSAGVVSDILKLAVEKEKGIDFVALRGKCEALAKDFRGEEGVELRAEVLSRNYATALWLLKGCKTRAWASRPSGAPPPRPNPVDCTQVLLPGAKPWRVQGIWSYGTGKLEKPPNVPVRGMKLGAPGWMIRSAPVDDPRYRNTQGVKALQIEEAELDALCKGLQPPALPSMDRERNSSTSGAGAEHHKSSTAPALPPHSCVLSLFSNKIPCAVCYDSGSRPFNRVRVCVCVFCVRFG